MYKFRVRNIKNKDKELKKIYKKCSKCGEVKYIKLFIRNKRKKDLHESKCKKCSADMRNIPRYNCEWCEKKLVNDSKGRKFCSIECFRLSQRKRISYKCNNCGKDCEMVYAEYIKYKNHYCSFECKNKHNGSLYSGENNPCYSQVKYDCDYCGKECSMKLSHYTKKNNHYCSVECMGLDRVGKYLKENSPRWNPNKTNEDRINERKYDEYSKWRKSVFNRDNYLCQCCGKGGEIEAHHINGYNWDIENRTNIDNGITLCKECHKSFHTTYRFGDNTREQFEKFYKMKTGQDLHV